MLRKSSLIPSFRPILGFRDIVYDGFSVEERNGRDTLTNALSMSGEEKYFIHGSSRCCVVESGDFGFESRPSVG
jgi:hypothetical protein